MKTDELLKNWIIPFVAGGVVITGVKYSARVLGNPAITAIVAALPIGLITMFLVLPNEKQATVRNYFYVTCCLMTSIMILYLLLTSTSLNPNVATGIALACWLVLVIVNYYVQSRFFAKKY